MKAKRLIRRLREAPKVLAWHYRNARSYEGRLRALRTSMACVWVVTFYDSI